MTTLAVPSAPLTPDQYKNYALQDPGFLGLQSALQGNEDAYRAQARGGINKGVISLGVAPPDSSLNGWLDSGTSAAAAANPLSQNASLLNAHHQNLRAIQNSLAARGGYDSGELPYGLGNENTRDTQAHADAMGKFMDYANGLFGNLGSMQAGDASQLGSELGNAAMRQLALHPGSTTAANWDDATGTYVDSSGNHYDQYGNHIATSGDSTTSFTTLASAAAPPPTPTPSTFGGTTDPNNIDYKLAGPVAPTTSWGSAWVAPEQPILTSGGGGGPTLKAY